MWIDCVLLQALQVGTQVKLLDCVGLGQGKINIFVVNIQSHHTGRRVYTQTDDSNRTDFYLGHKGYNKQHLAVALRYYRVVLLEAIVVISEDVFPCSVMFFVEAADLLELTVTFSRSIEDRRSLALSTPSISLQPQLGP